MFLVLVEYVDDAHPDSDVPGGKDREWKVTAHGRFGTTSTFPTREAAEEWAMALAARHSNRYAVVEITEYYERKVEPQKISVGPVPVI